MIKLVGVNQLSKTIGRLWKKRVDLNGLRSNRALRVAAASYLFNNRFDEEYLICQKIGQWVECCLTVAHGEILCHCVQRHNFAAL